LSTFLAILLATPAIASATPQTYLQITNLSGTTLNLSSDALFAMPKTILNANLQCYGAQVAYGNWGGVKLSDLLNQAGLDSAVASIDFTASDGYHVSIPIQTAMQDDVIVAYELDSGRLSEGLRLVIPEANGNLWISMITSISMSVAVVIQGESTGVGSGPEPGQSSSNSTEAAPTPTPASQPTVTPQPAVLSTVKPTVTPTNVTQLQSDKEHPVQKSSVFSAETLFLSVLGATVAVATAGFAVYRYKKRQR
jgi:hypothetical protein